MKWISPIAADGFSRSVHCRTASGRKVRHDQCDHFIGRSLAEYFMDIEGIFFSIEFTCSFFGPIFRRARTISSIAERESMGAIVGERVSGNAAEMEPIEARKGIKLP